jgi:thymidylate synthase
MNNIDSEYQALLTDIIQNGTKKTTRNGETLAVFGRQIRHKMSEGFPLLTTKKMAWRQIVTELLWFLRGDTSIEYLLENDCHIWDGDAYKNYAAKTSLNVDEQLTKDEFIQQIKTDPQFAKVWGNLGPIYGKQWRDLGGYVETHLTDKRNEEGYLTYIKKHHDGIDQIADLIKKLKNNPDSRRMVVSAWNVKELDQMTLPPCHYGFQVYTRELSSQERMDVYNKSNWNKDIFPSDVSGWNRLLDTYNIPTRAISLMYNTRSQDVPLGTPFNIASYALLLMMIAKQVNMIPDELIANMGDCHIYLNQIDGVKEQLTRQPYELPTVKLSDRVVNDISEYTLDDVILENYQSHPKIKAPLSN